MISKLINGIHFPTMVSPSSDIIWYHMPFHYFKSMFWSLQVPASNVQDCVYIKCWLFGLILYCFNLWCMFVCTKRGLKEPGLLSGEVERNPT